MSGHLNVTATDDLRAAVLQGRNGLLGDLTNLRNKADNNRAQIIELEKNVQVLGEFLNQTLPTKY